MTKTRFVDALDLACLLIAIGPSQAQAPPITETVVHNFGGLRGMNSYGGLTADSAGNLYGTASAGGAAGLGVVFKLDTAGHEIVLHQFAGGMDGEFPYAGVIGDAAGNLYGTTYQGGSGNLGVVYRVASNGQETVLYSFLGGADGAYPKADLILDAAGNLYGTTSAGGSTNAGTVFKIDTNGQETVLYTFTGGLDGREPLAGLIFDPAGNLYGTTDQGGTQSDTNPLGYGVVFKLDTSGQETVLHSFSGADGANPSAGLVRGQAGDLYGTTQLGGSRNDGVVFRLDTTGHETVLHSFTGGADGSDPIAGLILDPAGNLYGTTHGGGSINCSAGCGVVFMLDAASRLTVLYGFLAAASGYLPSSGVIRDTAGNLYGTTLYGGSGNFAKGVVYKLDTSGQETVLCTFTNAMGGTVPSGGVIRDTAGNLYGTASDGGEFGQGVVFEVGATGVYTILHNFTGNAGGGAPANGVIRDAAGNLYGTAGATYQPGGVLFKLEAAGLFTVLHRFPGAIYPASGLIRDAAGNLYGTTDNDSCTPGSSVYKLDAAGNYTTLYNFTGGNDGCHPRGGLILDPAGNLYGTTGNGGTSNSGTVFKLDISGLETVLYSFTDDAEPYTGVVRDAAGNLYGTARDYVYKLDAAGNFTILYNLNYDTVSGLIRDPAGNLYGTYYPTDTGGAGVVYKLDAAGNYSALYTFTGGADGDLPSSGVILDPAGNLYGTTSYGGKGGDGVVFKLAGARH